MNGITRLLIVAAVAVSLALALARIDFSVGPGAEPGRVAVVAASDFTINDVQEEGLGTVAPVGAAIQFFKSRVAASPQSYIDLTHLAAQHLRAAKDLGDAGGVEAAIEASARALEINPEYPVALVTHASALAANHRFKESMEWAERVPESSKSFANALAVTGDGHLALGNYEAAEDAYGRLHQMSPGRASLSRLAHLSLLRGDTDRALALARMAAEEALKFGVTSHEMAWHLSAIGEVLLAEGEALDALDHFKKALELAPDHIFALAGTGHSQWMSGDLAGSAVTYGRALRQSPDNTGLMVELTDVYRALGRVDEAKELVETAIAELRDAMSSPEIVRRELAQVLADEGIELELAVSLATDEIEQRQDVYAYDLLAWTLYRAGEFKNAASAIEKAMSLGTRDAGIHYRAGLIYSSLGETDRADKALSLVQQINPNFSLGDAKAARQMLAELRG